MRIYKKMISSEAARILDVTPATVRDMERRGELAAERTSSGVRLFDEGEVRRLATERAAEREARGK